MNKTETENTGATFLQELERMRSDCSEVGPTVRPLRYLAHADNSFYQLTEAEFLDKLRSGEIRAIAVTTDLKEFDTIVRSEWTRVVLPFNGKYGVLEIAATCDPFLSQAYGDYGPSTRIAYV
jgi:hypothetical protein